MADRYGDHDGDSGPARGALRRSRPVRVASVPAGRGYVRALAHPGVWQLPDPAGPGGRTFLDPAWVRAHADDFDVMHVHYGFESLEPAALGAVCDELRRRGKPLVYTVHTLPGDAGHPGARHQDEAMRVLLARADRVIALTPEAARVIRRRFARAAVSLAHPHVVPLQWLRRERHRPQHSDAFRVALNFDREGHLSGPPLLRAALEAASRIDGLRLRIDLPRDLVDPASAAHEPILLGLGIEAVNAGQADLHLHGDLADDELWAGLESVDALVLVHPCGRYPSLVEACRDLGTAVITPTCAYPGLPAQQRFKIGEGARPEPASLAAAMRAAMRTGRPEPPPLEERVKERATVAAAHHALYRALVAQRTLPTAGLRASAG